MSALAVFNFEQRNIRAIVGDDGEPWFVAADVCDALSINTAQIRRLDEDEKGLRTIQTPGGAQQMAIINESGLYSLILTSRKPEAKRFKKWVTSEVLPAIRRTGAYVMPQRDLSPLEILKQQVALMEAQQAKLAEVQAAQQAQAEAIKRIEARQTTIENGAEYYTVLAYCKLSGMKIDNSEAQKIGIRATKLSRARGIKVGKSPDTRFGTVNSYHESILAEIVQVQQ